MTKTDPMVPLPCFISSCTLPFLLITEMQTKTFPIPPHHFSTWVRPRVVSVDSLQLQFVFLVHFTVGVIWHLNGYRSYVYSSCAWYLSWLLFCWRKLLYLWLVSLFFPGWWVQTMLVHSFFLNFCYHFSETVLFHPGL